MQFTDSNNLPLLDHGDLNQMWGVKGVNRALALIEQSSDGMAYIDYGSDSQQLSLTPKNGVIDNARQRNIVSTGDASDTKRVVTIPNRPKVYFIAIRPGQSVVVKTENNSDQRAFVGVGSGTTLTKSVVIIHTDGTRIYDVSKKQEQSIVYFDNMFEGSSYSVTVNDNGKTIVPINAKPYVSLSLPAISTLPDGFNVKIVRGPADECGVSSLDLVFGASSLSSYVNAKSFKMIASKEKGRWVMLRGPVVFE